MIETSGSGGAPGGPPPGSSGDPPPEAWDEGPERLAMPLSDSESLEIGPALMVDLDGFEGPLDLLLALARTQKLDLTHISMAALADQYLAFIAEASRLRLELAADYLVMAAWLAFLKSRLLLPKEAAPENEPTGEELARRLAFRLMRLGAMRDAAARLMNGRRLGRDVFARGTPEGVHIVRSSHYTAEIYDLLKAYGELRRRTIKRTVTIRPRTVWSIKQARVALERLVGTTGDWVQLDRYLARFLAGPEVARTALASSFGASLEMAREGLVEIRQAAPFQPLYVRTVRRLAADAG